MAAETTFTVKIAVQQDGSISLIDQAGQKIASLGQAADAAKGGLGALEQGTQAVGSAAQSAGTQMGDAGNKAGELGSKAASSSSGISSMASTLLSLDAAVRLANVAFDLGKAAFDAFFMNIVDRAGSLDDLSQKIGVAGTTLSQFSLAAQATGTSVEGLGTGFKMLSVNLTEAANGGNESAAAMKSAFQTLGVDVTAALSDTNSALLTISDTFAAMPDGAEKTALAMQLFGKAGVEMIPFLNQGSEGIAKMTELNDKLGLSFSGETLSALDNFGDQLTILGNVGTGVFTQLVSGAAPVLSQMADALVDMAAKAGINSGTLQEWGRTIAETVVNAVATALGAIGQFLVDIESAGIGSALYNAFAAAFESVKAVAASAMASVKASIYDALSVLPLIGSSYAEAAANMRASAASYLEGVTAIGQGSTAIGNAGRALLDTSSALKGVSSSANEAGGAIMSAADGADQMSSGMSSVASGADLGHQALQKLTASGTTAGGAVKGAGDAAGAAGAAAGGAAGGVDKLSQAMDKLAQQSTQIATKQGIYDAYIEGAINYEQALIALDTAQIGGEEATQNLTVAMQAEAVAREQAAMALTQQTAEQMNKNAQSAAEVAALESAIAAGKGYESSQLSITAAVIQYQAEQKLAAGFTGEQVAAWAEAQMQAANYKTKIEELNQVLKNNDQISKLQLELNLRKQVAAGVITQTQAERQMAIAAAGTNVKLQEQAGQIFDLTKSIEDAKDSYVHIGDILKGAFDQAFDAVIAGTRDLGDALEGIALSIGKQIFSNMLDAKFKDFDPTMKKNFLDLGEFGKGIFGDVFSGAADQAAQNPIGQNEDGSFIYGPGGGSSSSGGGGMAQFFGNFMAGMGMGAFGKGVTDSFRGGPSSTGSKGWDTALGFQNMVSTGLAQALGGPLAALLVGVFNSFLPDIVKTIRDAFDTTTKGTKQREKGEDYLGSSPTFSALQDKSKLGDFTRDENKRLGLFDNYRTGVATAIERGMKEGEANALKGAGQGIFSVIFKNDGDAMVNGAMDMGRGMAELLSRGLADGMTYDEMLGSLRSFAKENDISFKDALIGVNNFGKAAIEQFDKVGHADWGAQEFADGIYGISEIFKNDFPQGVNLASIALQTMEKDGSKAFQNLDAGTKQWILSVANDAEAFKTVFASLAQQGFTIDTAEFEATLADITASAEFVGANIGTLLSAPTLAQGMQGLGEALKTEIKGDLGENMLGDLFDTTGIATAFQDLFANINDLKSGEMSSGDFMSGMAEAIASGKANLEEYLPRIKAMRDAMAEVEAAVDEAFKPTAAEELAAATEAMAAGLKDSFGGGIAAAMDAALAEGGDRAAGIAAFGESMRGSIKDSVKNSIIQGMVEAAMMQGPLAEMMATFGQAFKAAVQGGITSEEQAMLNAYLGQMGTVADQTIAYLQPSVDAVLQLGEAADSTFGKLNGGTVGVPNDPALAQFKKDVAEAQTTLKTGFSSAVSEAFSMIGQGKSVEEATAAFSESFKTSISSSVAQGLQEALVQSAVMEGALGTMMAQFKEATAAAMADGVITGAEQANLAAMAQQIKTTGEAAANALAPVVASVATIATGVASGTDSVSFNVNTNAEASAAAADATISNSATVASETVSAATTSAADTVTTAVAQAGDATAAAATSGAATTTAAYADAATLASDALNTAGTSLSTDVQAATDNAKTAIEAILGTGDQISQMAPEAAYGIGQSLADVRDKVAPEMQAQIDALIGSLADASLSPEESERLQQVLGSVGGLGDALPPDMAAQAQAAFEAVGAIGQALTPDMAAQANAVIAAVGNIGDGIDPATIASTQQALSSLATIGTDVDPSGVAQFSAVTAALADGASAMGDPGAVVDTMKALGEAALSSGDAANLAGTMQALGAAALDSGTAANMGATLQAFANASAEGANNTTAVIDAFSGIDAGSSAQIKQSLEQLVSTGVVDGAAALSTSLGGDAPDAIVAGLQTLQSQLDAGELSSLTDPLNEALGSMVNPADSVKSALDRLMDPTRNVTDQMGTLENATRNVINAFNSASSSLNARGGTPAAATGGSFAGGSAVVGEAGRPELVSSRRGGGFNVTPLTWPQAKHLMRSGTPGMAVGGVVGGGQFGGGGGTVPPAPTGGGGGGGGYTPNAEGAEFADFTSAIVEAFRAGFEGSKSFIEDFSDSINESVRTRLVDAIMQGFAESPAIQKYADNIDTLITKAQSLAGNNKLTAEELANIQSQIKENTDAIGEQADVIDELLEPMRQAEAISTAISDGLDFSSALKNLALNPDDLEGFRKSIDQTVNDAVLNGAIQGLLASGPIQDAVKKFGDSMNDAMATALEDGVITAEESSALHDLAVSGSAEMKTAMEALGPVLSALGIDLGDAMTEGINRAKDVMKAASSEMDPFAALGEGETQFGNFTQSIRDQVYGNIRDGMVQAFIDSAVTQGLLAGPMMAIQSIFDQIGQKQITTAQANAALAEQVAAINGSLNDPAFKAAFDTTMASINQIGQSLGQTSKRVESSAITAASSAQTVTNASKDVCAGKCKLEKDTQQLGFAAVNTFGRSASVSVEQMIPKMALGGLVTKPTFALVGEAGPELVIPARALDTRTNIQRLADIAASSTAASGGPAPVAVDMSRMIQGSDNTVTAIKDLHDRLDKLSDAILAQPTEVSVQMDRETLMRAMAKADRLKKKARYGATA